MHGLANRALQRFVSDTYGPRAWGDIAGAAELGFDTFEPMLVYDDALTEAVLAASTRILGKPRESLLEDMGIYLVAHPNSQALRRLMRFGGDTFGEFLVSLEDLPERARLAMPDLDVPTIDVVERSGSKVEIKIESEKGGYGPVLSGLLQGMSDDYGVLVTIERRKWSQGAEKLAVQIHDLAYSEAKHFDLAQRPEP